MTVLREIAADVAHRIPRALAMAVWLSAAATYGSEGVRMLIM